MTSEREKEIRNNLCQEYEIECERCDSIKELLAEIDILRKVIDVLAKNRGKKV